MTASRRLSPAVRMLLVVGCLLASAHAGILTPEWSRPLTSPVISASRRSTESGTEELFLLLADRRVMVVSLLDSLTELGRAPEGTAALVALPGVRAGAGVPDGAAADANTALLLAVRTRGAPGSCSIVAWNRRGQPLWEVPAPELRGIDSLVFIGWSEHRAELCAWQQGEPWLVLAGREQVSATRLNPGFIPIDALIVDLDRDRAPELVFFDGRQLAVYHLRQNRELRCRWPDSHPTGGQALVTSSARPLVACAVFDSVPVLLVLTGDTLRYIDHLTGVEKRWLAADSTSGLPGIPRSVCASGSAAYVAGEDRVGRSYLAALNAWGAAQPVLRLPLPGRSRVYELALLKNWPMPLIRTGHGAENILVYAPGLDSATRNAPGHSGTRLLRVLPLRIDRDTFPDLVVVRTAADARWRVDVFSNRLGIISVELEEARQALQRAALGRDGNDVARGIRRVAELTAEIGPNPTASGPEARMLDQYRRAARRRSYIALAGALLVLCLVSGLVVLVVFLTRRRRPGTPGRQIEDKPLPTRYALAAELVAVDHNFMSKGNTPAAIERLIEIRGRHGLVRDRDLGRLAHAPEVRGTALRDIYTSTISRLIDATPTLPVLDFIETTARSAPRGRDLETLELSQEEYRRRVRGPGIRLITIVNHECPDCYRRLRLFADPEFRGTLEHIILDHLRHAGNWAEITLGYTVNTQWNRRLLIRLLSDSPHAIPLRDPRAHITSQLLELAARLGPAIETPRDDVPLAGPHEKLWLRITDYIAVLEEIRDRLLTP